MNAIGCDTKSDISGIYLAWDLGFMRSIVMGSAPSVLSVNAYLSIRFTEIFVGFFSAKRRSFEGFISCSGKDHVAPSRKAIFTPNYVQVKK